MSNLKYADITEKIIGASFEVHKFLGNGFQEVIYQRALAYEMRQAKLEFAREIEQHIYYKDLPEPIGTRRADLKIYKFEVGLLINFGSKSLTFKRLVSSF
jgi:PD-(D/E)XK nuclease superfamily